jgi:hypothetical protein
VLRIISLSGQIIFNETVYGSLNQIDLSRLQSGLYQIIVSSDNSVLSEKFVKK